MVTLSPPPPFQTFNTPLPRSSPTRNSPDFCAGYPLCHDALKDRIASWEGCCVAADPTTTGNREREAIPAHTRPVPPAPRRASRFSSASSRSGLRVTRPRLVTRKARAHARTRGRRQAADSFRAATAKRHRNRGENAAGPCAFDVVACTPSSRSTNERVSPRVFSHRSTTTTAPIERVISGDPSPPRVIFFSPVERLRKGGRGGCTRVPRGGIISRIRRGGGGRKRCDRRVAIARRGCVLTAASAIHVWSSNVGLSAVAAVNYCRASEEEEEEFARRGGIRSFVRSFGECASKENRPSSRESSVSSRSSARLLLRESIPARRFM